MKMDYIRKLTASYMVLEQEIDLAPWEERMIASVSGQNILFAECVREDGGNCLWYDITGKQALDTRLECAELGLELLCKILMGVYESVEILESILLQAEGLLLLPESVFVDCRSEQIYFCYYPGSQKGTGEAFTNFMEYLLTKLDHRDERALKMAYEMYDHAVRVGGEGSLRELKNLLCISYGQKEVQDTPTAEPGLGQKGEVEKSIQQSKAEVQIHKEKLEQSDTSKEKDGLIERLRIAAKQGWDSLIGGRKLEWFRRLPGSGAKPKEKIFPVHWGGMRQGKEEFVFEPEPEGEKLVVRPTVLLSEIRGKVNGVLRYEGEESFKDLVITEIPYLIGSEQGCSGYIPSPTVSRQHAKITRKEEVYFIEDLNSANGTCVGGEILDYKRKVSLKKNEVVIFANEKFRFI